MSDVNPRDDRPSLDEVAENFRDFDPYRFQLTPDEWALAMKGVHASLLPCPKCDYTHTTWPSVEVDGDRHRAKCSNCGALGPIGSDRVEAYRLFGLPAL